MYTGLTSYISDPKPMPTISLSKTHDKSADEILALIEQLTQLLQQKFQIKCQLKHQENNDTLTFTRLDMSGQLCLMPSEVTVTVKTGFLTAAFTPVIKTELKRTLDKYLA